MFSFLANIFGYLLNFLYEIIGNYGWSIILFSLIIKLAMLPISMKQQKTMKRTVKVQEELKKLQIKNKNNPEALQRETMELYKREGVNPFAGCFSGLVQFFLLISVFFLVKSPLTYMKKVDSELIEKYTAEINSGLVSEENSDQSNQEGESSEQNKNTQNLESSENSENSENAESSEEDKEENKKEEKPTDAYPEITIIREKAKEDENVYINMEFLGLDLSSIPSQDMSDFRTYIIPVLYVITTFISIKITTSMQKKQKKEAKEGEENTPEEPDVMAMTNKNMQYMMPILAVSVSLMAPLGLALYWLTNNIIMICERLLLNTFMKDKEEKENA